MSVLKGRWEKAAEAYATGEHKSGRELELVVQFAHPAGPERALDIGAGAGHTALALAPHVRSVVVTDPIEAMLAAARRVFEQAGVRNAEFMPASAERLPFQDGAFDIVTSRLAAHHFEDVPLAMREVARVLRPGGVFVFVDTLAPEDEESAAFQDEVALRVEQVDEVRKAHDFEPWLERGGEDTATMRRVRQRFLAAPPSAVRDLQIVLADGQVTSFTDRKLVLAARRSR